MKTKTGKSGARTAYGETLATPIPYTFTFDVFENMSETKPLTDKETLKVRNAEELAKKRGAALALALTNAGIVKPTAEDDPMIAYRNFLKDLRLLKDRATGERKYTEDEAREKAAEMAGVDVPEDE